MQIDKQRGKKKSEIKIAGEEKLTLMAKKKKKNNNK